MKTKNRNFLILLGVTLVAGAVLVFGTSENMRPVKLIFVGDMMFDRTIRKIAENKGYDYLFSCVKDYLQDSDLVIGNLEGPITVFDSLSRDTKPGEEGNTTFTFDKRIGEVLHDNNIRMVNLGNNHIFDFGKSGASETIKELAKAGVSSFGVPGESLVSTTTIHGMKIAFINFNQFLGVNDPAKTREAIWEVRRENDFVAVYAHWGEEYVDATDYQKAIAHGFVNAGADIVIGSHPHVIQEHEIYKGKHIYYSLGNFIFDQYWNDEVKTGAVVGVALRGKEIFVMDREVELLRDGRTCLKE